MSHKSSHNASKQTSFTPCIRWPTRVVTMPANDPARKSSRADSFSLRWIGVFKYPGRKTLLQFDWKEANFICVNKTSHTNWYKRIKFRNKLFQFQYLDLPIMKQNTPKFMKFYIRVVLKTSGGPHPGAYPILRWNCNIIMCRTHIITLHIFEKKKLLNFY